MHPVRLNVDGSVTLLQEDDVGHHLRTGVGLERIVGQADRTQQLRPLRDVLTDFGRLFVHRIAGCHKGDHAAGPNLVERLGKKVVVNGEVERLALLQDRYFKQCRQGAADFGLTVSSRCRLVVPKADKETPKENKFAKFA